MIANGQHNRIQFYNCSLLPNAEMNDPAYRARYGLDSVPQRMIDMHGPMQALGSESAEYLDVVVATAAMPARRLGARQGLLVDDRPALLRSPAAHSVRRPAHAVFIGA